MDIFRSLCLFGMLACSGSSLAATRPTVVELYTSEGCSSCPPADQLLETLSRRPDVLALAFHVRYWDSLGWPDRFALALADDRQSRYARRLALPSVFTPQLVVEGERSFVGSDQRGIVPALAATHQGPAITLQATAEQLQIRIADGPAAPAAEVLLLALLPQASTAIGRGENSGRTLREVNVVRAGIVLGSWSGTAQNYTVARSALPADAGALAVLVQQRDQSGILGARMFSLR
ncbi:MAG: DUF1223 domain-containing protein [Steroidobacteraceae bacterium]